MADEQGLRAVPSDPPNLDAEMLAVSGLLAEVVERTNNEAAGDIRRWLWPLLAAGSEIETALGAELERAFPL